jgi:hypothetical protein
MDAHDRVAIEDLVWGYADGYDTRDWVPVSGHLGARR